MKNLAKSRDGIAARIAREKYNRNPSGVELWRGPSRFNGKEIVVIATFRSRNEKTGSMIQVWILGADDIPTNAATQGHDETTCGTCPFRNKSSGGLGLCYVNLVYTNQVWNAWREHRYPKFEPMKHLRLFAGRTIRWGAYGDPAMFPASAVSRVMRISRGHTGYSHVWRETFASDWKPFLMASVETPEGHEVAKADGWRTFRIRRDDEPILDHERVCPASPEGGQRATCEGCLACDGVARGLNLADLSIIVHGKAGNAVRFTRLSIAGRFAESAALVLQAA
jgi:hypothetical protein